MNTPERILELVERFGFNEGRYKDREIDRLVYELYDLSEEETSIIEN